MSKLVVEIVVARTAIFESNLQFVSFSLIVKNIFWFVSVVCIASPSHVYHRRKVNTESYKKTCFHLNQTSEFYELSFQYDKRTQALRLQKTRFLVPSKSNVLMPSNFCLKQISDRA